MNVRKINIDFFKDMLFPSRCVVCECLLDSEGLCSDCWSKIRWISEQKCRICSQPFTVEIDSVDSVCAQCLSKPPNFDKAVSVFVYDDFSKKIVLKFKHSDATYLAEILSKLMFRSAILEIESSDLIIPVPIHFMKRLKQKYNQSELLAQKISKISGVKCEPRILKKIKQTSPQEGLSGIQRRKNVIGSFGIDDTYKYLLKDKRILLIDDVFTTGSTVDECSKILKKHTAKEVIVLTLARVVI